MSSPSSPTLLCDVRSRRAERTVALLALLAGALGPSLVTSLDTTAAWVISTFCVSLVWLGLWLAGWIGARRIVGVTWMSDGCWRLTDGRGTTVDAVLRGDSRVGSHWAWLRWTIPGSFGRRSPVLLLVTGDVSANELRRLLVRLRILCVGRNTAATQPSSA
jgi:hypothetical protein